MTRDFPLPVADVRVSDPTVTPATSHFPAMPSPNNYPLHAFCSRLPYSDGCKSRFAVPRDHKFCGKVLSIVRDVLYLSEPSTCERKS